MEWVTHVRIRRYEITPSPIKWLMELPHMGSNAQIMHCTPNIISRLKSGKKPKKRVFFDTIEYCMHPSYASRGRTMGLLYTFPYIQKHGTHFHILEKRRTVKGWHRHSHTCWIFNSFFTRILRVILLQANISCCEFSFRQYQSSNNVLLFRQKMNNNGSVGHSALEIYQIYFFPLDPVLFQI